MNRKDCVIVHRCTVLVIDGLKLLFGYNLITSVNRAHVPSSGIVSFQCTEQPRLQLCRIDF